MNTTKPKLRSILLVDDDHSNNFISKIFIGQLNMQLNVNIALNGVEALNHLRDSFEGPCLIILDIFMPVMDGWEFLEDYHKTIPKEIKDQVVIVMITMSSDQNNVVLARKNPYVAQYLQKPLSDLKFKKLIKKYF